jgi:peptide/nickel transport system substrate-binding protein
VSVGSGPAIGAELGGYRLEALVGRGGMGAVYRAEDLRLGRRVALKFLAPELAQDGRFRERFLAESRLAASIDHAGIVPIFEAGEVDGLLYIAMRYVEGTDLRALLRRDGPLEPGRAVALVAQLAGALDAAHARGLVHRDVKPSNALVAVESGVEHVYLADFGLTKHTTSRGETTASGQMEGTVDYVAPEQIRGGEIDGRADLYSLGCVLFECLTGEVPFPGASEVATIYAHLEEDPPRASARRAGVPPALDAVVTRALAKDPARRWRTGNDLASAARAALPANARRRRRPRSPRPAVLAAVGLIGLIAAVVGAIVLTRSGGGGPTLAAIDANAVAVIDPVKQSLTAQIPMGASPGQLATGYGAVWVTNAAAQTVSRIDPATYTIRQTIPVGSGAGAIAVGERGVWVVNSLDGSVSWISPATNRVVKTIPVGNGPSGICVGGGSVWVANADDRTVWRLNPRDGGRMRTTRLEYRPTVLACGGDAVWAGSEVSGTVTRISAATGKEIQTFDVGAGVNALAFAGGTLWAANALTDTVSAIDPLRGGVVSTIELPAGAGPVAIAADRRGAWVSNEFAGAVVRIDRRRGLTGGPLRIGNRPAGLAVLNGALWVGVRASGARHRGGTLRILSPLILGDLSTLDPAVAGTSALASQIANIAYDGLTAVRRVGGPSGRALVPDLAVSLPTPTDHGTTYTFRVQPGIHYSNGELVRASDIRRGIERTLRAGTAGQGPFFADIVGARTCLSTRRGCDLSRGIIADDNARTITLHLARADPDLPAKLALSGAAAISAGTHAFPARLLPAATGPYVIAGFERDNFVRLVRNPRFHAWSGAAKPDGYPDAITVRMDVNQSRAVHTVERGGADYVYGAVALESPRLLGTLFTRYAGQVQTNAEFATRYLFLNTRVPPFDNRDARRALNFAVDRNAAVALEGGPNTALPTCQILPPNYPGYAPYCPYTTHPGPAQGWSAPDLRTARRLIARSHTRGMRVDVWGPNPFKQGRFAVRLLDDLGYHARLRLLPATRYWRYISDSRNKAQIGLVVWISDYPAPSDFLQQLFACRSFHPDDPFQVNWSEFCDPDADRLVDGALRRQPTDPRAADALWKRAERRMVDEAAALPLDTPKQVDVVSRRVGDFQYNPQWGVLFDQLWVR